MEKYSWIKNDDILLTIYQHFKKYVCIDVNEMWITKAKNGIFKNKI